MNWLQTCRGGVVSTDCKMFSENCTRVNLTWASGRCSFHGRLGNGLSSAKFSTDCQALKNMSLYAKATKIC